MNNWAPFLTGYQKHEIVERDRLDLDAQGRRRRSSRASCELRRTSPSGTAPSGSSFTLTGLNEAVDGGGTLRDRHGRAQRRRRAAASAAEAALLRRRSLDWLFRRSFRRMHGAGPARLAPRAGRRAASRLTFTLRMDAGGPTGPLVNAMLGAGAAAGGRGSREQDRRAPRARRTSRRRPRA